MYDIFVLHFSKETIHPKVSVLSPQRTDDETGFITFSLVVHVKTADLVVRKEGRHRSFSCLFVGIGGTILYDQVHLVRQIPV